MNYIEAGIEVIKLIELNGFKAYFVGGVVRDYLLNCDYHDIDIATDALPNDLKAIFTVSNKGIEFSSVVIEYEGYTFETTTFREELSYEDNRHPDYRVIKNLDLDLVRRDFTINAMAMDKDFNVIDLFDGKTDLSNKLIKTVGNPTTRFTEDALRMLRACYFAAKLDFVIEEETLSAIKDCAMLIKNLSNDRIMWELRKIVESKYPMTGFRYLMETGLLDFMPDLKDGILTIIDCGYVVSSYLDFLTVVFFNKAKEMEYYSLTVREKSYLKDIYETMKEDLTSNISLYKAGLKKSLEANNLKVLYKLSENYEDVIKERYEALPLRQLIELKIRGIDIIKENPKISSNMISKVENELITEILLGNLSNDFSELKKYLLKKYK